VSAAAKLAGFAAVLLLVFGGAVAVGGAIGPERDGSEAADADDAMSAHGADEAAHGGGEATADPVRGLAASADGLTLALEQTQLQRRRPTELRFAIVGSDGRPVRDFEVEHEKRMHLIVVRRDGSGFQHLHPKLAADGTWSTPIKLDDAGDYRVFADFKREGENHTLATDVFVDGPVDHRELPRPATTADAGDGYQVDLHEPQPGMLEFEVAKDGKPVEVEPYLGAGGHLVALREGDLAYLHVHPVTGEGEHGAEPAHEGGAPVAFETEFPSSGRYGLYLQFKHDGKVRTAQFTRVQR